MSALLGARFSTDVHLQWFCVHEISSTKYYDLESPAQWKLLSYFE